MIDVEYFRKRAIAERLLASASANDEVTALHEELAAQYEALVAYPELRSGFRIKWAAPLTGQPTTSLPWTGRASRRGQARLKAASRSKLEKGL
ncbi:MAG: hypothetical protein ABIU10_00295 [Sphingomicrobium sp.]